MKRTVEQLKQAFIECNQEGEPFETIRYALETLINLRQSAGRKQKYAGDAKERNRQAVQRVREKKKIAEAKSKDDLKKSTKALLRAGSKRRTALEAPIDLRPKKKKKPKWRRSEKVLAIC